MTDAELMEKAFTPVFNAEDLHKQGNYQAIATVMMYNIPSAPFTMSLLPPMGEPNPQLMESMKAYTAARYGRTRAEVEQEIQERWKTQKTEVAELNGGMGGAGATDSANAANEKVGFLESWRKKKAEIGAGREEVAEIEEVEADEILEPKDTGEAKEEVDETVFKVR